MNHHSSRRTQGRRKPELLVFSPLPPIPNGIADYTAALLAQHVAAYDCTAVIADAAPVPELGDLPVGWLRMTEFLSETERWQQVRRIYHIGNNPDHAYLVRAALELPGIVVLHDVTLHYLMECASIGNADREGYTDIFRFEYGPLGAELASQFHEFGWRPRQMFFELPLTGPVLESAKGCIVHSLLAQRRVRARRAELPVFQIPHFARLRPPEQSDESARRAARVALGLPPDGKILLSLGFVTEAKQTHLVLRAVAALRHRHPDLLYVIAGRSDPREYDVQGDIQQLGLESNVKLTGFAPSGLVDDYIVAADLVCSLRYPTAGETSGVLLRALGLGRSTLVFELGTYAELPDDAAIKIRWTRSPLAAITLALGRALSQPERRAMIERNARRHAESMSIEACAEAYHRAIESVDWQSRFGTAVRLHAPPKRLPDRTAAAAEYLQEHPETVTGQFSGTLFWHEMRLPSYEPDELALVVAQSRAPGDLLTEVYDYPRQRVCRLDPQVLAEPGFDPARRLVALALLTLPCGALPPDIELVLGRLNQMLAYSGLLIVNLWDSVEQPSAPQSASLVAPGRSEPARAHRGEADRVGMDPVGWRALLERAGFVCLESASSQQAVDGRTFWNPYVAGASGQRELVAVAAKVSEFVRWRSQPGGSRPWRRHPQRRPGLRSDTAAAEQAAPEARGG